MTSLVYFHPALGHPTRAMGRKMTIVSVVSLSVLMILTVTVASLLHSYRGAVRHHKSSYITHSHSSLRTKHKSPPKNVERLLLLLQYPVANSNITQVLNSHPNMMISQNFNFLDLVANFTSKESWEYKSVGSFGLFSNSFFKGSQLSAQSDPGSDKKKVSVIGFSAVITAQQVDTVLGQHHLLQDFLKKLSSFPLPVSVLFVNTSDSLRDDSENIDHTAGVTDLQVRESLAYAAKFTPVLTLEQHSLSPLSLLTEVCTFLRLRCP